MIRRRRKKGRRNDERMKKIDEKRESDGKNKKLRNVRVEKDKE